MAVEPSPSPAYHENVDELVAVASGDREHRLEVFMRAREAFRKVIGDHADHIFRGLFEHPERYEQDALCILGRTREVIGDLTPEKVRALIELSKIDGFGFVARLIEDAMFPKKCSASAVSATQEHAKEKTRFVCGTELVSSR